MGAALETLSSITCSITCSCRENVFFALRPGVVGQDDIAVTLLTKHPHLQLPPKDLHRFYRLFVQLEDCERDRRAKDLKRLKEEAKRTNQEKNEFDEDVVIAAGEVVIQGEIDKNTVFDFLCIPKRAVNMMLFSFFTADKHMPSMDPGKITFVALVASLWHFLSFNAKWLGHFLFSLFNEHNRPFITHKQLLRLVTTCVDGLLEPHVVTKLEKIARLLPTPRSEGQITHAVFSTFLTDNPLVLKPLLTLQEQLRGRCFGTKFWLRKQKMRFRHKEQLTADFLVKLNAANHALYLERELGREVETRMEEWRRQRDEEGGGAGVGSMRSVTSGGGGGGLSLDGTAASPSTSYRSPPPVVPTSLLVLIVNDEGKNKTGAGTGGRKKKKRRRHSRKPVGKEAADYQASLGPFGGPQEWIGRRHDLGVELEVPPHVMAALEAKAARKAEQKAKRVALRGRGNRARIAAELPGQGQKYVQMGTGMREDEGTETGEETGAGAGGGRMSSDAPPPPSRPRLKYLPKLQPPAGRRGGQPEGQGQGLGQGGHSFGMIGDDDVR